MEAYSWKKVMIFPAIVFAFERKSASQEVLVHECSIHMNPEYSSQAMSGTASLINSVPYNKFSYSILSSYSVNGQVIPFCAHGACNGQVDVNTCRACLIYALYNLNACIGAIGGRVKLTDCRLRYEAYEFDFIW